MVFVGRILRSIKVAWAKAHMGSIGYIVAYIGYVGDAENARNGNTRHENAAPKIRGENGKSET